eukprot:2887370-Amphidinium_carterae.1
MQSDDHDRVLGAPCKLHRSVGESLSCGPFEGLLSSSITLRHQLILREHTASDTKNTLTPSNAAARVMSSFALRSADLTAQLLPSVHKLGSERRQAIAAGSTLELLASSQMDLTVWTRVPPTQFP